MSTLPTLCNTGKLEYYPFFVSAHWLRQRLYLHNNFATFKKEITKLLKSGSESFTRWLVQGAKGGKGG